MDFAHFSRRLEIIFWVVVIRLMENRRVVRYAPTVIVVVAGLLAGSLVTLAMDFDPRTAGYHTVEASPGRTVEHSPGVADQQQNTLLILVDRLDKGSSSRKPALRGVWLVVHLPSTPRLALLPLYPLSAEIGPAGDAYLAGCFDVAPDGVPAAIFLDLIRDRDVRWQRYILLDELAVASLVELVAGLEGSGDLQALEGMALSIAGAQQSLLGQAAIADGLCRRSTELARQVDPKRVLERMSGHLYTDFQLSQLFQGWQRLREQNGGVSCQFPTLQDALPSIISP